MAATMSLSSYGTSVKPSQLEVDYDVNITSLYEAICSCDWDKAVDAIAKAPHEAKTWVVRHYEDDGEDEEREIMWRFLPIHSACARDPPASVISALLKAYPDGAHCVDDQGMYPLHYACGNQASREVIRLLLVANSMAARCQDPRGMLPIHYLACWGPSSVSIIDMVMVANRDVGKAQDNDGNTALDLAMEGDYPERDAVVMALKRWLEKGSSSSVSSLSHRSTPSRTIDVSTRNNHQDTTPQAPPAQNARALVRVPTDEYSGQQDEELTVSSRRLRVNSEMEESVEVNITSPLSTKENIFDEQPVQDEEEKEALVQNAGPSPRTISRLRQEVTQLRAEKHRQNQLLDEKLRASTEELTNKCQDLSMQVEDLNDALAQANERIAQLETESSEKDQVMTMTESQLSDALEKVAITQEESNDLRQTLADVADERDKQARKTENLNDRLGSLAASLASMMERQDSLMQGANERNAQLMEASQARSENLRMLFNMEQEFMETVMSPEEGEMSLFEKQLREMDAISAVIAAMRGE